MSQTVVYRAYAAAVGAGVTNAAQIPIVRAGRITAVLVSIVGIGGAGTGVMALEVVKNQNAGGTAGTNQINNPQRELSVAATQVPWNTSAAGGCIAQVANVSIPVIVGDYINIGTTNLSGTAASPCFFQVDLYVLE